MSVKTLHPDYQIYSPKWRLVRDSVEGESAVKRAPERYLPEFIPSDPERYKRYVQRAYFMGVTGRTRAALSGMVFRKDPMHELPDELDELKFNADGSGTSLEHISKEALGSILDTGRHIFLVDYPTIEDSIDFETEQNIGARPLLLSYNAEALINWKYKKINGRRVLTLAVLVELVQDENNEDEFDHDIVKNYRVLRLRDGVYTQQMYDDGGSAMGQEFIPRMAGGQPFDHIPMYIAGADNNLPDIDDAPLYDLAILNIAHYRNTADLEEAGYITGQPTLHLNIGDTNPETFVEQNPNGVQLGSRSGIITQGGSVELVQPEERSLLVQLKDAKEQEMVKIGARLIQRGGQAETAEAARINASAEASTLDQVVNNLSYALTSALMDAGLFVGLQTSTVEDIRYDLNTDFFETSLDAQQLMALIQLGDVGVISRSIQRDSIRKGRIHIPEEMEDEEIDGENAGNLL
jgi:hypothetical protein